MSAKIDYKKYNYGLCLLRMLMAFEVILAHLARWEEYNPTLVWPFRELITLTIPCFLMMSFYYMSKLFLSRDKKSFKKRLVTLTVPLIGWAIIYFVVFSLIEIIFKTDLINSPMDLFWQMFTGSSRYLNPTMWFQLDILVITIIFFTIFYLLDDKKAIILLIILSLFCYYLIYTEINYNFWHPLRYELRYSFGRIAEVFPFAVMGFCLKYFNILEKLKKYRYIVMIACVLLFMFGYTVPWAEIKNLNYGGLVKLYLSIWIYIFAYVSPFEKLRNKWKRVILIASRYTMVTYCGHLLVNTLLIYFLPKLSIPSIQRGAMVYMLCYALGYFIDLIDNKYTKMMV